MANPIENFIGSNAQFLNALGNAASLVNSVANRHFQEKMLDKQNDFNEAMMDKANAYNSPAAQMQRLKEAGLNPNLIYGQQAAMDSATAQSGTPSGGADMSLANMMTAAQIRQMNAGAEKDEADAQYTRDIAPKTAEANIADSWASVALKAQQAREAAANVSLKEFQDYMNQATMQDQLKAVAAQSGVAWAEYQFCLDTYADRVLGIKRDNQLKAAHANYYSAEAQVAAKLIDVYGEQINLMSAQELQAKAQEEATRQFGRKMEKEANWVAADHVSGIVTNIMNSAANIINAINPTHIANGGYSFSADAPAPYTFDPSISNIPVSSSPNGRFSSTAPSNRPYKMSYGSGKGKR